MSSAGDEQLEAMHRLAQRLAQFESRVEFGGSDHVALDGVVREFADRVERLQRELDDLRGMLEGMNRRAG
jgi:hypothetical protein